MNSFEIYERAEMLGNYILDTHETIRSTASAFQVSKTVVHKDITERLEKKNPALSAKVRKVLDQHLEERAMRGGEATRQKYLSMNR